ncbi:hypothetical protein [Streptomyces sp. NPDC005955]|uniref:hypothetical protein n=1 Tax=Streptomyces sp. NPDC005955 TaxID=3364738 RepID=UPI0036BC844E
MVGYRPNNGIGAAGAGGTLGGTVGGVAREELTPLDSPSPGTIMVTLINDGGETYLDTVPDDDRMRAPDLLCPEPGRETDERLTTLRRNR